MRTSRTRRLANALAVCAMHGLPAARTGWARAMYSELAYLSDANALRWAIGCCVAAITLRVHSMTSGELKISRYILVPEMLLCFLPLCLLWYDVLFATFGLWPGGPMLPPVATKADLFFAIQLALTAVIGLLGPIGLLASLWSIVSRRPLESTLLGAACIAGPVILGLVHFARALLFEPAVLQNPDMWRFYVLLLLPPLAALHLRRMGLWTARKAALPAGSAA